MFGSKASRSGLLSIALFLASAANHSVDAAFAKAPLGKGSSFVPSTTAPKSQPSIRSLTGIRTAFSRKGTGRTGPLMSLPNALDTLTSGLASILRMPSGTTVDASRSRRTDIRLLKLYDVENSRDCRAVRERVTEYDLVVERVIPCSSSSRAMTDHLWEHALPPGADTPTLVVQNGKKRTISGVEAILEYLDETFGTDMMPEASISELEASAPKDSQSVTEYKPDIQDQMINAMNDWGAMLVGALRPGRGTKRSSAAKEQPYWQSDPEPLILYSYENNQFCRLVREVLTELDIVYELRSCGKMSPRREELAALTPNNSTQCPYLVDPNAGVQMAESADIIEYLYKTYGKFTPPDELLEWTSNAFLQPIFSPILRALTPSFSGSNSDYKYYEHLRQAKLAINEDLENAETPVVIYTLDWSPFSKEALKVLDHLEIEYTQISLGPTWVPGFMKEPIKRAALLEQTGQSSLPHIFVNGKSVGGLFSGSPGLIPALENGSLQEAILASDKSSKEDKASAKKSSAPAGAKGVKSTTPKTVFEQAFA